MYVLGINGGTGPNTIASLFRVPSPNTGTLITVSRLDIPEFNRSHFDIGGTTNTGYADILTAGVTGRYGLYKVDLSTGALTLLTLNPPTGRGFTVGLGF
jgi:hypothetical protein